ncbi:MAG: helix-turn-helix domain-containing protein [Acidimicrobiales bacterium]
MDASEPSAEGSPHVSLRRAVASMGRGTFATESVAAVATNGPASAVAQLGQRIRQARLEQAIGVRELARRVDCSASMISQIEKGLTNPSVSTLYSISRTLGISTDTLIAGADPPSAVSTASNRPAKSPRPSAAAATRRVPLVLHRDERRVINLERGVRWELLTPVPESSAEFMEVTYGVGGGSTDDDHAIRHNGREYSVILEGQLSVQVGFEQYVLEPGDSMAFDSTIPHRFWNAGPIPVRAIWFVEDRWPSAEDL